MKHSSILLLAATTTSCLALHTPRHHNQQQHPRANSLITCPIVLPGQVPLATTLQTFDTNSSLFKPTNVKGPKPWSQILLLPSPAHNSRFDADDGTYRPVEVTIDDDSIFKTQYGFRRAGLQFANDTNPAGGPGSSGVRTLHWSVRQDASRPLNLTHEYLNVWHETADFSANQFNFQTGTLIDQPQIADPSTFKFLNRQNQLIWSVPISAPCTWQNFAITLDFDANTLQIYYSKALAPLLPVTPPLPNDNSGAGQYQIGILKKPTGTDDVVNSGFQEAGIHEGQIYGGIFLEDSAGGCVSL